MTPAGLSREVRAVFAYAARYLATLAGSDPHGSAASLLTRPDVEAELQQALDRGRALAQDAVREAWGGGPGHEYLDWLLADVDRSYNSMAVLRAAVRTSWHSAAPEGRAEAIRDAVLAHGAALAARNRLSAEMAATAAESQAQVIKGEQLQSAGEEVWKQWRCRRSPPDPQTCHWCRALHGMVLPLSASFPAGDPVDLTGHGHLTRPPRVYRGILRWPPRHPRCRCRIVILTNLSHAQVESEPGGQEAPPRGPKPPRPGRAGLPSFLAASDVRAIPEDRYQVLVHFLEAAVHELGQVLARLRRALRREQ